MLRRLLRPEFRHGIYGAKFICKFLKIASRFDVFWKGGILGVIISSQIDGLMELHDYENKRR